MRDLKEVLKENKETYIQKLKDLIAIDTHDIGHGIKGGLEKQGQEYMKALFSEMGASDITEDQLKEEVIQECLRRYNEGNPGHNYDGRYNVYATFSGKGGKSIMFNSHIDTMPAGDLSQWKTPPHEPTVLDGKLYGLGSADMKAGLMASTLAVQLLYDAGYELPGDVIITSVCDEEGGGNGSMQAAMNGVRADGVVNCEGTSGELILAHMGFVFFRVEFEGKANHSGAKWKGVSAIEKAMKVINALSEMEHNWLLTYRHPLLPAPNLNIGVIHGGTAGSTVAGDCYFETCVHYIPNQMSYDMVVEEFTNTVTGIASCDPWMKDHPPKITIYQAGGGFEMDPEDEFVHTFCEAFSDGMGTPVKIVGSPAGCDSRIWRNIAECPTIQFGPGNLEQCHSPNEYVELDAYLDCILIYAKLILAWGGR
ncbi:MAG: ArgE/DapE family deacylase [Clostridiales bacterium]|nr:ArgE/DapE family deacylase [Clostridiales bacterium]